MGSPESGMRVVSLLPSATEILFALGAGDDVVGVTFECDHPPQARTRRVVSTSALPEGLPPAEIDALVSARMAAGEDLYHLDEGALRDLDADLVVTQDLCAVCAVDVSVVDDALAYLGSRADVLTLDPQDLGQVLNSVTLLGRAVGCEAAAVRLLAGLRTRLDAVATAVRDRPPVPTMVLEWTDPPFAPGHWVPEMVTTAGGTPVIGTAGKRSERIIWQEVAASAPEVVVCAPCGFDLAGSVPLAEAVVTSGRLPPGLPVWAVDANASFARPGPRLVDGVEALAAILHPDAGVPLDTRLARRIA
ncbi:ABC transporter substrate-binding protein [Actinopolymorpha sp. B17G11]|uniref:ABC transporter substrate-binding protein n=1 Tax=Actinopolymorpha sp. B17G11 TaxID=3160861 RepID=UPI0032E4AA1A